MHRLILAVSCIALLCAAENGKTYEAVIRGSMHVTVFAKSFYDARDKIRAIYCGGTECITEGPWESH